MMFFAIPIFAIPCGVFASGYQTYMEALYFNLSDDEESDDEDGEDKIPQLTDKASWNVWRDRITHYYDDQSLFDAATYLYCVSARI